MRILAVNAGSSSLKLRVLGADDTVVASRIFRHPAASSCGTDPAVRS